VRKEPLLGHSSTVSSGDSPQVTYIHYLISSANPYFNEADVAGMSNAPLCAKKTGVLEDAK
jgi:hypothetical protein